MLNLFKDFIFTYGIPKHMENNTGWIVVSSRKFTQFKPTPKQPPFKLTEQEKDGLDTLSTRVYNLLRTFNKPLPASFIRKTINSTYNTTYSKKEIGDYLYDGDLSKWVIITKGQPNLWSLPLYRQ